MVLRGSGGSRTADVLSRLQTVSDAALAHLSLDDLLSELLKRVTEALGTDTCAVLLLDETGTELVARAAKGIEEEVERGVRVPVGRGFAGRVAKERRTITIPSVEHADIFNPILREKGIKSLLGTPLIAEGRVLGVIHVGSLTPRAFTQSEVDLLEIVAHRVALAVDRALAYAEVVRLTEVQRDFVALAAHELRTPATTVYGLAATLYERRGQLSRDLVEQLHKTLHEQADRMRRLVEQLLDLSRLDAAQITVAPRRIPLRKHLEETVVAFAPGRESDVAIDVPPSLEVAVDPSVVERVVANLVSNAFRYGAPPVVMTAAQSDHHVRIHVEDSGPGVAEEFVPYMFERFRRSAASADTTHGSGLGLAIARSYARAHGGDLLYAPHGRGARFELVLPAPPVSA